MISEIAAGTCLAAGVVLAAKASRWSLSPWVIAENVGIWLTSWSRWMQRAPQRRKERRYFMDEQRLALTAHRKYEVNWPKDSLYGTESNDA